MKGHKLSDGELERHEAKRDIWREVLDGIDEIKAGGGKRYAVEPKNRSCQGAYKDGSLPKPVCGLDGRIETNAGIVRTGAVRTIPCSKNIDQNRSFTSGSIERN